MKQNQKHEVFNTWIMNKLVDLVDILIADGHIEPGPHNDVFPVRDFDGKIIYLRSYEEFLKHREKLLSKAVEDAFFKPTLLEKIKGWFK